jgi:MFS family permease
MISTVFWGVGFGLIWVCGVAPAGGLLWAVLGLGLMAIAMASYTPIASALVVSLAPDSLRGVYLSLNSQCWAIGYLIGPALGGAAMDQPQALANGYWLMLMGSIPIGLIILRALDRQLQTTS